MATPLQRQLSAERHLWETLERRRRNRSIVEEAVRSTFSTAAAAAFPERIPRVLKNHVSFSDTHTEFIHSVVEQVVQATRDDFPVEVIYSIVRVAAQQLGLTLSPEPAPATAA